MFSLRRNCRTKMELPPRCKPALQPAPERHRARNNRFIPLPSVRVLPPQNGERGQAHGDGQQRAERCRKPHGEQRVGEQPRGDIRARNAHQHNRQRVVHERKVRFLAGAEVAAEAEMHVRENAVPDVAAQVLAAEQHDAVVPGEHGDNLLRREKDNDGNRRSVHRRNRSRIQKRPPRPLLLARAGSRTRL